MLDVPSGDLPPHGLPAAVRSAAASPATRLPMLERRRAPERHEDRIVDVLIDRASQPQAVVLDLGGLVNTDRRSIAASWGALRFVTRDKRCIRSST